MKPLVLVGHPNLAGSTVNRLWFETLSNAPGITTRVLTDVSSSDLNFDVDAEQDLLMRHDRIVLQFPFYWYSAPPVMKAWLDQTLTRGFAYGPEGDKLRDKELMVAVSTGGPANSYLAGGYNNFSMSEFLKPFQQTALLSQMAYLKPFVFHGAASTSGTEIELSAGKLLDHILDPDLNPKARATRIASGQGKTTP